MIRINENYTKLVSTYLFSEVARRIDAFQKSHPERQIVRLGIGDVTLPLTPAVVAAFQEAVAEMGAVATFRGYGPDLGYDFLRQAIAEGDFRDRGAEVGADEVFISDGRYGGVIYLDCVEDNGFVPDPPRSRVDLVYLCFPNNPTGATITRDQLA